jgi:hypothetical protein
MLTKLGSTLGLQSAGRVMLGGGGGDTGVVLGPFANWAALPASGENSALAGVVSLGPGNAYGIAVYDAGASEWALYMAWFDTVADMTAFSEPITTGALASVEASASNDETGVRYQYDGAAWARTAALTAGYAWTLTLTQAVTGADPSGVGAVQAGDYGVYTPAGGTPIVYRLTAPLALPGGGTQAQWLPPEVYAGTVAIQAYLVGTEVVTNDVALNAQGWPTVSRTNGTITTQTTRVRLATTAASGAVSISTLTSGVTSSTKVYLRMLMRAAIGTGATTQVTTVGIPAFGDGSNYLVGAYVSANTALGTFFWDGTGTASSGVNRTTQASVAGLAGPDDLVEVIINTANGIRTCEMYRNGVLVSTSNVVVGAFADQLTLRATSGSTATQTATLDVSGCMVATW